MHLIQQSVEYTQLWGTISSSASGLSLAAPHHRALPLSIKINALLAQVSEELKLK
jgi:hypothetical protein